MSEGLIETGHNPAPLVPLSFYDYSSEDDCRPLRFKRRVASSSRKKLHGKSSSRKERRRGAFSSKKSDGKEVSSLKMGCRGDALSEELRGKGKGDLVKGSEEQDAQPGMQHHGAFSPENLRGKGSCSTVEEEDNIQGSVLCEDEDFDDDDFPPEDDDELILHRIGWRGHPYKARKPELCWIMVDAESCEVSDFVQLLKEIGCEDRYVARSVESPAAFYANLNAEEIAKLKGVDRIRNLVEYRYMLGRC